MTRQDKSNGDDRNNKAFLTDLIVWTEARRSKCDAVKAELARAQSRAPVAEEILDFVCNWQARFSAPT